MGGKRNTSLLQAFERFAQMGSDSACWPWTGTIASVGYGQVSVNGKPHYAHRLSWELAHGRPPARGEQIRHTCDNRWCVNPAHLLVGSFQDNMQDAIERARFKHSEDHWKAKLTADDVRKIRHLASTGVRHQDIAEQFGIVRSAVTNIVNRRSWRHVE